MEISNIKFIKFTIETFHRQNPSTHLELRLVTRTTPMHSKDFIRWVGKIMKSARALYTLQKFFQSVALLSSIMKKALHSDETQSTRREFARVGFCDKWIWPNFALNSYLNAGSFDHI
jgi:hypothetical protein